MSIFGIGLFFFWFDRSAKEVLHKMLLRKLIKEWRIGMGTVTNRDGRRRDRPRSIWRLLAASSNTIRKRTNNVPCEGGWSCPINERAQHLSLPLAGAQLLAFSNSFLKIFLQKNVWELIKQAVRQARLLIAVSLSFPLSPTWACSKTGY